MKLPVLLVCLLLVALLAPAGRRTPHRSDTAYRAARPAGLLPLRVKLTGRGTPKRVCPVQ